MQRDGRKSETLAVRRGLATVWLDVSDQVSGQDDFGELAT